jgi:hypothetical protein
MSQLEVGSGEEVYRTGLLIDGVNPFIVEIRLSDASRT